MTTVPPLFFSPSFLLFGVAGGARSRHAERGVRSPVLQRLLVSLAVKAVLARVPGTRMLFVIVPLPFVNVRDVRV